MTTKQVTLTVNGEKRTGTAEARTLLSYFIREELGLTGTHIGCIVGRCGACSVLLDGKVVKSCMIFAQQVEGAELTTIEGITEGSKLHPIQEAFWEHHGLQCGYCTPGMIMTAYDLLQDNPNPTEAEIREGISGNLCMCTGYVNIVKSVEAAADKMGRSRKTPPSRSRK